MKTSNLLKPELDDHSFGSAFDPVLNGVAQGLARLFPPLETTRTPDAEDGSAWRDEIDTDTGTD